MDTQGLVQTNPINKTDGKHIHNFSTFDESLSYRKNMLLRFGDYTPSFEMEGVPDDDIELNSADSIDSLSLNAPFKGRIRKIKESFSVPNMAILPRNWDLIYVQPSNGEDVIASEVNCIIEHFPTKMSQFFNAMISSLNESFDSEVTAGTMSINDWLSGLLRAMVLGEYVYSKGSLLNFCGYKANAQFMWQLKDSRSTSYDNWFDAVISAVFSHVTSMWVDIPKVEETLVSRRFLGLSGEFVKPGTFPDGSFRRLLEIFRENPMARITSYEFSVDFEDIEDGNTALEQYIQYLGDVLFDGVDGLLENGPLYRLPYYSPEEDLDEDITALAPQTLNLSRLLAYQLVCAHFYSNSSLDVNYTAELFRSFAEALSSYIILNSTSFDSYDDSIYSLNGIDRPYDAFSGHLLNISLFGMFDDLGEGEFLDFYGDLSSKRLVSYCLQYWALVFGFRKSLRYGDYFVASRPRPLAPINTDVGVNNGMVSVVDVTRKIQAQRFANSVMRTKQKIEEYVKSLFGRAPAPDYHNPFFLTRQEEYIFGDDVQNTAETQSQDANSRTANFASNMGRYTFTFHNDDNHPCIYLQIISFDIKRAYTRSVERFFLHADRFDMFNPDFQYIGDQAVYGVELGYPEASGYLPQVFAYQTRDMEYKQRFDVVCGDFEDMLPGWILTDNDQSREYNYHLNSDFIRSYNTELDQFYLSLSGFSLGRYFHFVCLTDNNVRAKRAMAVDPQILA